MGLFTSKEKPMSYRQMAGCAALTFSLLTTGMADTLTLKDGRTINGTYLGGTSRQVRMEVGDGIQTFEIGRIAGIQFGSEAAAPPARADDPPAPPADPPRAQQRERGNVFRPDPSSETTPSRSGMELPAGTVLTVRMIDPVDSEVSHVGETFRASIDEPVVVGSEQVIPRGADVVVKLVDDKQSGKISGKTELTLDLVSVFVNGKIVDINTESVTRESSSRTGRSGKVIGGTAALGAIIGGARLWRKRCGHRCGRWRRCRYRRAGGARASACIFLQRRLTFTLEYPVRI
jgi:hypothetical protein